MTATNVTTVGAGAPRATDRGVPPLGGINVTFLGIELRRLLRNRRTIVFSLVMPPLFFLAFGSASSYRTERAGAGNVTAVVMVSMAVYGAMLATTSGGAMVSMERMQGWSRQLRLTPLHPRAYVAVKLVVAMMLGLAAVVVVFAVGWVWHASMPARVWVAWVGSLVFAAFGLFMGYLLPSENVMQVMGPVMALLAFAGGLFIPLEDGSTLATIAQFVPTYGLSKLSQGPLVGADHALTALANLLAWGAIFAGGAAWLFRRDTARV